jgi:hypothetical protein
LNAFIVLRVWAYNPFEKEDDVAVIVSEILWELETLAEMEDCWVECEVVEVRV